LVKDKNLFLDSTISMTFSHLEEAESKIEAARDFLGRNHGFLTISS
jgi:hypothetical protein